MRAKLLEWLRRYAPLEIASTLTAVAGGWLADALGANPVAISYAAAWSENIGYYGVAFAREVLVDPATAETSSPIPRAARACRRLLHEFGLAELLDSFIVRPLAMWTAMSLTGSTGWGIVVGKIVADVVFYAIAIVFYERAKASR